MFVSRWACECVDQNSTPVSPFRDTPPTPLHPRWSYLPGMLPLLYRKVLLARVLTQVVKASLILSVRTCLSLHLEAALSLNVTCGNTGALKLPQPQQLPP